MSQKQRQNETQQVTRIFAGLPPLLRETDVMGMFKYSGYS
jgi:hypothetical protein